MAERFYVNCALQPGPVLVHGAEAHHLAAVCRLRAGDTVCLFNGDGHEYRARIEEVSRRHVSLEVFAVESPIRELPFCLHVAAPLPRGDRAQFLLEKLTELGIASFTPLRTARSVVHPRETKRDKLQRHVIEASKQCGRNVLLEVRPMIEWTVFSRDMKLPSCRVVAHPGGEVKRCQEPFPETVPDTFSRDTVMAVGPEGGFTEEEIAMGRAAGWRAVDLGPRILRVETAAIVLAVLFGHRVTDWQTTSERPR